MKWILVTLLWFAFVAIIRCANVINVEGNVKVATVSSNFLGFTTDWWVQDDPTFGEKWYKSGILTLDLSNEKLIKLVKALAPATWRIGGTPADTVVYDIGHPPECPRNHQGPWPQPMCLNMSRWDEINSFVAKTGVHLAFGLNGLYGRANRSARMNTTNIQNFLQYTANKGYKIFAFELGNELGDGGQKGWRAEPQPYAQDAAVVRSYINQLWPNSQNRPGFVAPDSSPDPDFTVPFLKYGKGVFTASTYHSYAGSGMDPKIASKLIDPSFLNNDHIAARLYRNYVDQVDKNLNIWGGEVGPAYHGGAANVTNRYLDSFWYLDHLGILSRYGVQVFARSTLTGGDYELLDRYTLLPNPDYFVALLWKRTTGTVALNVTNPSQVSTLRSYAMCHGDNNGSFTLIAFNLASSSVTFEVQVNGATIKGNRHSYYVQSTGALNSNSAELKLSNGRWMTLELTSNGDLPPIHPIQEPAGATVTLPAYSYVFLYYPDSKLLACPGAFQSHHH